LGYYYFSILPILLLNVCYLLIPHPLYHITRTFTIINLRSIVVFGLQLLSIPQFCYLVCHSTSSPSHTQYQLTRTCKACKTAQHATRNTQRATRNAQHATRNTQRATRNAQHATRNTQRATRNTQHATLYTQHSTRNTLHATRTAQHTKTLHATIHAQQHTGYITEYRTTHHTYR
jgi:hypothetical protein